MSQKLLRVFTVFLTGIVTLALLAGGSYAYNKIIYTDPLEASVTKLPAVGSFKIVKIKDRSVIIVQFNIKEKLRTNFYLLLDQLENQSGDKLKDLTIEINNTPDADLDKFLKKARLPIYEAISTGQLTNLPDRLAALSKDNQVVFDLEVDNHFIFLTANSKKASAHFIINRNDSAVTVTNTMGGEYL